MLGWMQVESLEGSIAGLQETVVSLTAQRAAEQEIMASLEAEVSWPPIQLAEGGMLRMLFRWSR
jgi:hypothetical protein